MSHARRKLTQSRQSLRLIEPSFHFHDTRQVSVLIMEEQPHGQKGNQNDQDGEYHHVPPVFCKNPIHALPFQAYPDNTGDFIIQNKGDRHIQKVPALINDLPALDRPLPGEDFRQVHISFPPFFRHTARSIKNRSLTVHHHDIHQTLALPLTQFLQGFFNGHLGPPVAQAITVQCNQDCSAAILAFEGDKANLQFVKSLNQFSGDIPVIHICCILSVCPREKRLTMKIELRYQLG